MTQLRKISQGLSGKRLTPEPEEIPEPRKKRFTLKKGGEDKVNEQVEEKKVEDGTKEGEWEDADKWAEQRDGNEMGEIGERNNYVGEVPGGEPPKIQQGDESSQTVDKEKRKAEKKAKRKAEKQESEAKRRKAAED